MAGFQSSYSSNRASNVRPSKWIRQIANTEKAVLDPDQTSSARLHSSDAKKIASTSWIHPRVQRARLGWTNAVATMAVGEVSHTHKGLHEFEMSALEEHNKCQETTMPLRRMMTGSPLNKLSQCHLALSDKHPAAWATWFAHPYRTEQTASLSSCSLQSGYNESFMIS